MFGSRASPGPDRCVASWSTGPSGAPGLAAGRRRGPRGHRARESAAANVLLLLFISILLASALEPIILWLRARWPLGRGSTILVVYLAFFADGDRVCLPRGPRAFGQAQRIAASLPPFFDDLRTRAAELRPAALSDSADGPDRRGRRQLRTCPAARSGRGRRGRDGRRGGRHRAGDRPHPGVLLARGERPAPAVRPGATCRPNRRDRRSPRLERDREPPRAPGSAASSC